jgi:hypothetical protein
MARIALMAIPTSKPMMTELTMPNNCTDVLAAAHRLVTTLFADTAGSVLYSGRQTIRPGPIYVMGFNPGGDPKDHITVADDLQKSIKELEADHCAYIDNDDWGTTARSYKGGDRHPFQKRYKQFAGAIGLEPRAIPATNAIFRCSRTAAEISVDEFGNCWQIHALLLNAIRPKAIVCIGNGRAKSAYALLASQLEVPDRAEAFREPYVTGRSFVVPKLSLGEFPPLANVVVVGLPHFSRFSFPAQSAAITQLKATVRASQ